jgi:hypothetical protein
MVQYQIKLRLTKAQKKKQREWLPILGSVFNFGIRKIELNARDKVYFLANDFRNLLAGHNAAAKYARSKRHLPGRSTCPDWDKSLLGGTKLIFPENRNSTKTCSTCGGLTGPSGLGGLAVREWTCGRCGARRERDVNAARNALISGLGWSLETVHANA